MLTKLFVRFERFIAQTNKHFEAHLKLLAAARASNARAETIMKSINRQILQNTEIAATAAAAAARQSSSRAE